MENWLFFAVTGYLLLAVEAVIAHGLRAPEVALRTAAALALGKIGDDRARWENNRYTGRRFSPSHPTEFFQIFFPSG